MISYIRRAAKHFTKAVYIRLNSNLLEKRETLLSLVARKDEFGTDL